MRTKTLCTCSVGLLAMLPLTALGQTPDTSLPGEVAAASTTITTPAELRRSGDGSVDRNILMPSAETIKAGDVTFNSYELLLAGLTYGVTDNLAITGTALLPITKDMPWFFALSAKYRIYRGANDIFSLQPNFIYLGVDDESVALVGAQALYDHVFDAEGRFTLTLAMSAMGVLGATEGDVDLSDGALLGFSGAFSCRVGKIVKLLGELYLPGAITREGTELVQEALLFNYGLRFFSHSIAVDLTFLRPIHPDADTGPLLMGAPFVAFSARF